MYNDKLRCMGDGCQEGYYNDDGSCRGNQSLRLSPLLYLAMVDQKQHSMIVNIDSDIRVNSNSDEDAVSIPGFASCEFCTLQNSVRGQEPRKMYI